jgi:ribose transport system permease protein
MRLAGARLSPMRLFATHGLLILTVVLIAVFSLTLPSTFPTVFNTRSTLASLSVTAFVALAVTVPLAGNQYDLSVGNVLGMASVLSIGLQVKEGVPWVLAVIIALVGGTAVGLANGVLVAYVGVNSFIATLGLGTAVLGLVEWYTNGLQLAGALPQSFLNITNWSLFKVVPGATVYLLVVALVMWVVLEYMKTGRRLYAFGFNPRAAELVGVRGRRYIIWSLAVSGLLSAIGGVVLSSQLQAAQSTQGTDYLLPAFVGALLGATSVRPGRVNVGGTLLAVLLLAVGISGLDQMGASFYVTDLFDGGTLVLAVSLAAIAARRRLATAKETLRAGGEQILSEQHDQGTGSSPGQHVAVPG